MKQPLSFSAAQRAALIVGHPGHELRVWGWMHAVRPVVAVLTDGGGRDETSRLHLSETLCRNVGASISTCFGMMTDQEMYQVILGGQVDAFRAMADRLATMLIDAEVNCVVADAAEGYNPTHDVCRLVADRAVRIASTYRPIDSYSFLLTGSPVVAAPPPDWVCLTLDEATLARKIAAAREYAATVGGTLLGEINALIDWFGTAAFAREYLQPLDVRRAAPVPDEKPFYEIHGERQVALGHYRDVIRLADHVAPIARALGE